MKCYDYHLDSRGEATDRVCLLSTWEYPTFSWRAWGSNCAPGEQLVGYQWVDPKAGPEFFRCEVVPPCGPMRIDDPQECRGTLGYR